MANKMLGKVVAGAALGGASLLVFNPAMTYAAGHHEGEGKVLVKPDAVKPGDHVKLLESCPEAQEHAAVWSKVTGEVNLNPVHEEHGDWTDPDEAGQEKDADQKGHDGKDRNGREEQGTEKQGTEEQGGDEHGNGPDGYYGTPKPPEPEPPADADMVDPADGEGGSVSDESDADQGPDGQMREGDQGKEDESEGHDRKDHDWKGHDEYGMDGEDGWEHMKDFVYYGEATVAADAQPGTYQLEGSCGEGELVVLPKGPVNGGDGGMTRTSTHLGMAAGGAGVLGAAALGGLVLMRRRRTNDLV
ncbi:hypothetical protein DLE60_07900 [Micromonospora globispora]|uniref:hypothetical protein n=1 Tax=Micromonospora globispora TaxID=1450148 RepID=UPI000D6F3E8D|nr:hypothetical protein [Micromonospora globispora]PWU61017.1 hypothetical protein DLE60_07900 [Micromonospora globispora]